MRGIIEYEPKFEKNQYSADLINLNKKLLSKEEVHFKFSQID